MAVESKTLKALYFQTVDNQALSTQGQADVNLHRLTAGELTYDEAVERYGEIKAGRRAIAGALERSTVKAVQARP